MPAGEPAPRGRAQHEILVVPALAEIGPALLQHPGRRLAVEALVHRLRPAVTIEIILPLRAAPQRSEYPVHEQPVVGRRSNKVRRLARQQRRYSDKSPNRVEITPGSLNDRCRVATRCDRSPTVILPSIALVVIVPFRLRAISQGNEHHNTNYRYVF